MFSIGKNSYMWVTVCLSSMLHKHYVPSCKQYSRNYCAVLLKLVKLHRACVICALSLQWCLCKILAQWLSTGGDFCLQKTFGNIWRHFWLSKLGSGAGCCWHMVGRSEGCLHPAMQGTVQQKRISQPKMSVEGKKPYPSLTAPL